MDKKHEYYFRILNHPMFGGDGTQGYIKLSFTDKHDNPVCIARQGLGLKLDDTVEFIEISKQEYKDHTDEVY